MHKRLLLLLLPALILVACGKKGVSSMKEISSLSDFSDYEDLTAADTMMYYFGQMQAVNFWQDAESDTMLRSEAARKAFMEGFRAAMAIDTDDSAYNKGLQLGLRLALRLREFNQRYGTDFSEEVLAASLQNFLKNNNVVDSLAEAQKGFYAIKDRFEYNTAKKEVENAKGMLAKYGKEKGFKMISDTLYGVDLTPGSGSLIREGDRIAVEVSVSTLTGKEVVTRQFPDSITLGEGRVPPVVREAIYTMKNGQTCQFMTTPRTLLGKRYNNVYHLPSDEPLIFTVKAGQN